MEVTEKKAAQVNEQAERSDSSFDRKRHIFGAIFGPLCALLVYFTQIEGLSPESHKLLAIMTLVAIWWITEPVAIPVTSIIGPTLCVVFGVVKMKEAFIVMPSLLDHQKVWKVSLKRDGGPSGRQTHSRRAI